MARNLTRDFYDKIPEITAVAIAYFITAKIGLDLEAVSGFATLVWAPTGIAIASMLVFGRRVWPGIFIAAAAVNFSEGAPLLAASAMGIGNMLEAVVAVYLLNMFGFRKSLPRMRDVTLFIVLAAGISTLVSASIGVASLWAHGIVAEPALSATFQAWWIGDMMGALIVAPFLLTWSRMPAVRKRRSFRLEAAAFAVFFAVISLLVFGSIHEIGRLMAFFLFLPMIFGAIRFGMHGTTAAVVAVSFMSIAGTMMGTGPFVRESLYESMLSLQVFMGIIAVHTLIIGAAASAKSGGLKK
ncbi:MAG: MASE1 domain-containing protein [Candidatus Aenigmarchaeota archaeon]|nr:MASE1 domain-containing protein [Candidatus Aenigmarchaeota archaeon]